MFAAFLVVRSGLPRALKNIAFLTFAFYYRVSCLKHRGNMNIETFAKMRALQEVHTSGNPSLLDHFLSGDQANEVRETLKLKRIQFDTNPALFEKLEDTCQLLDCSKREFLEMAVVDAIKNAERSFSETYKAETGEQYGTRMGFEMDPDALPVEVTK